MKLADELKGDVVLSADGESATLPDIPRPVLQALHREIVGTKESHEDESESIKKVTLDDIEQLSYLFNQWASQYAIRSFRERYIVTRERAERGFRSKTNYGSVESLKSKEFGVTIPVASIEVSFSIIIQSPETHQIHGFDVLIYISSELERSERRTVGGYVINRRSMFVRIEYSDPIVAKGMLDLVLDWFDALPDVNQIRPPRWLANLCDADFETYTANYGWGFSIFASVLLSVLFSLYAIDNELFFENTGNKFSTLQILTVFVSLSTLFVSIRMLMGTAYRLGHSDITMQPELEFNQGSMRKNEERRKKIKLRASLFWFVFSSILISFFVSVCAGLFLNEIV